MAEKAFGGLAAAAGFAGFFGAAFGLLEERGENGGEGDDHTDAEEAESHGSPEGDVAGAAGLLGDVGVGDAEGYEREEEERGGEDVKVASHDDGFYFTARCRASLRGMGISGSMVAK